MLAAWLDGEDTDGGGRRLPDGRVWQAELWRRLRRRIAPAESGRAAWPTRARGSVTSRTAVELPGRVCAVRPDPPPAGPARRARRARGRTRRPPLPAPPVPGRSGRRSRRARQRRHRRPDRPTGGRPDRRPPGQPPAGFVGAGRARDAARARSTAWWIRSTTTIRSTHPTGDPARPDRSRRPGRPAAAGRARSRVRSDRRRLLAAGDRSIQVHSCHGRARQVEVLRDAILHLLAEDPSLEPRDVIVMCPDIETFAPLIQRHVRRRRAGGARAGAGRRRRAPGRGPPGRPARAAGRPVAAPDQPDARRRRPAAGARRRAGDGVRSARPGRSRAGPPAVSASTTTTSRGSPAGSPSSGIRWGLDAGHRAPFKLDALPTGTWRAGLDRVLPGVAMTEDGRRAVRGRPPARRRRQRIDRPRRAVRRARRPPRDRGSTRLAATQTIDAWAAAIAARRRLLAATAPARRLAARRAPPPARRHRRRGDRRRPRQPDPRSLRPRSAACSPTASTAGRPGRTSAPAT